MATVTVKNIPDDLYGRLKAVAEANRRSVNSEIIVCIERAVASQPADPERLILRARQLRALTAANPIGDEQLIAMRTTSRPRSSSTQK